MARSKCAIYHRVSTDEQDERAALSRLRQAVRRRGGTVTLEVTETGSGHRADRPGWGRVLSAARSLDLVLVERIDRAGRSSLDLLTQIEQLTRAGCAFVAIEQGLEIRPDGDATSALILRVLASVAEFERALIRDRTRHGLARARARGVKLGRPVCKKPPAARVAALRKRGRSWSQIAAELRCSVWAARSA